MIDENYLPYEFVNNVVLSKKTWISSWKIINIIINNNNDLNKYLRTKCTEATCPTILVVSYVYSNFTLIQRVGYVCTL